MYGENQVESSLYLAHYGGATPLLHPVWSMLYFAQFFQTAAHPTHSQVGQLHGSNSAVQYKAALLPWYNAVHVPVLQSIADKINST